MAILQLTDVSKRYGRGSRSRAVLDRMTLGFERGTFTSIVGPSGSGKSTLLQCAAGLDTPTEGTVELDGERLDALDERRLTLVRRRKIGFVFQAYNLISTLTVAQNVALPLRFDRRKPGRDAIERALDRVGIRETANALPHQISGGQRQRAAIARALITDPAVIFADEPTGALDIASAQGVLDILSDSVREEGATLIVVTHDPVVAARADRVLFLGDGRVRRELFRPTVDSVAADMAEMVSHLDAFAMKAA